MAKEKNKMAQVLRTRQFMEETWSFLSDKSIYGIVSPTLFRQFMEKLVKDNQISSMEVEEFLKSKELDREIAKAQQTLNELVQKKATLLPKPEPEFVDPCGRGPTSRSNGC
jgi:hypothetical protein